MTSTYARPVHALGAGLFGAIGRGNVAISPYSVAAALGMAANGARGDTLAEMLGVLDASTLEELNDDLPDGVLAAELGFDVANRIYGQSDTPWEPDFLATLADRFDAPLENVDFASSSEDARTRINAWTSERTRDRIPEIVPAGGVHALTRLVLVNAIYLKAPWIDQFVPERTSPADFHLSDGTAVSVPTMRARLDHSWLGTGEGWLAVRMPYVGRSLAMTVVLPDPGRADAVDALVVGGGLTTILDSARPQPIELAMPRWTLRAELSLRETLARLGMPRAFDLTADFSGMTRSQQLCIDAVFHQVFVAVDEFGTEAAAATATAMRATSLPPPAVPVAIDRPFLFVIHDVDHGTPYFLGRVTDPR